VQPLTHAEAIASIGPKPPGDAVGMRVLAATIRAAAGRLEAKVDIRLDNWESDAARQAMAAIDGAWQGASSAAGELSVAAGILEWEAGDLATEQARWTSRYTALTGHRP
jgi:hypothetical protein